MGYTVSDLITKCIEVEQLGHKLYDSVYSNADAINQLKLVAKVLAQEELRHIELFDNLRKLQENENNNVGFEVFDKASKLVFEFKNRFNTIDVTNTKELIKYALDFENANIALLVSIEDELVKSSVNGELNGYDVLEMLINEERKHANNLNIFL